MARTLKKEKPIKDLFFDELITAVASPQNAKSNKSFDSEWWNEKPVDVQEFSTKWLGESLYPNQLEFVTAMTGMTPDTFSDEYDEGHAFWGKGSGKDRTISKMQVYVVYKLMCLKNPQKFLREKYGCSIGEDDAIDLANMSVNARNAQNVYFKKFKSLVRRCKNPRTGKNWFEEKGCDLRDGYDIQNSEVRFGNNITAHSLNSETNTGEGLNLFMVAIDEFGSFPYENGNKLLDASRDTVISRFPKIGKVCVFSYKYYHNDPMDVLFNKEKNSPNVFSSKLSTWDVNLQAKKENFSKQYMRNPERAMMTYECTGGEIDGGYVTKKYMLNYMFDPSHENPVKGDLISINSSMLMSLNFKPWFTGSSGVLYAVHVDLATGKKAEKKDMASISMVHCDSMYPKIDEKLKKDLFSEGINIEFSSDNTDFIVTRKGIVVDLALQLVAPSGAEVQMSDVRNFILMLKNKYNFNIIYVTYDGWESRDSIQILQQNGMNAEYLSVDKDNSAYESWKELMYQQLFKCYPHSIAHRECKELILKDGKVDHPDKSWDREVTEGIDNGSKDVIDSIVGAGKMAYDKIFLDSGIYFG